jgi:hypothetical protein
MTDHERDLADRKLEQLLSSVPPVLPMPDADKRRVLEALRARAATNSSSETVSIHRTPRHRFAAVAAAAAVALALVVLWPGGGQGGIVWADVAEQLMAVRTMGGRLVETVVSPDGGTRVVTGRLYFKDPGLTRFDYDEEVVTTPDGKSERSKPPASVIIVHTLPEDVIILQVFPERRAAIRMEVDVTGSLLGPWRDFKINPAMVAWSKLHELPSGSTRVIGKREVAGRSAIGFAAPLAEVAGPQPLGVEIEGEIRVWAAVEDAVPVAVEVEKRLDNGRVETDVFEFIEWDAPMSDSLFDDSIAEGFEIFEGKAHTRGYPKPELMPYVTLRIGPDSGGPVINELDVVGAVMGTVSFEPWRARKYHTIITFELTEEGAGRLRSYLEENPDTPMVVDFNGEMQTPWNSGMVASRFIQVELTPLRKRLIDFEREYLLHGEETVAAQLEHIRSQAQTQQ